jgi:hypothetical protein
MRHSMCRALLSAAVAAGLAAPFPAPAQSTSRAVEQSIPPPISQKPAIPPLHLSDPQRAKIRQAVGAEDTEVTFTLKKTKAAKDFEPTVGAAIPAGLTLHPLPRPLIYEMPALERYTYLKLKNQVLIVHPLSRKIVDVFPETSSG